MKKNIMGLCVLILACSLTANAKKTEQETVRKPNQVVTDFGGKDNVKYSDNFTLKCSGLAMTETKKRFHQDLSNKSIDIPEFQKDATSGANVITGANYQFLLGRYQNNLTISLNKMKSNGMGTLISSARYELKDNATLSIYFTTENGAVNLTALNCLISIKK